MALGVRKPRHDSTELVTRAIQPALWLLVFGEVFMQVRAIPTGGIPYLDFMGPGILAQSVLFIAIFYGNAIIWERDLEIIHKLLVSPTPRAAKGWSILLNWFGGVGPVPEGMSATSALKHQQYAARHARAKDRLVRSAASFRLDHGYTPPYWQLLRLARLALTADR